MPFMKPQLPGTLEEKVLRIREIQRIIEKHEQAGIVSSFSLDSLYSQRHKLELDISRHLFEENSSDPFLDYCVRNFTSITDKETSLEKIPHVLRFVKKVNELNGERIIVHQGDRIQGGIINNSCIFQGGEFRHLYVPILEELILNFKKGKWEGTGRKTIYILKDIFDHNLVSMFGNNIWETNYSERDFIGGDTSLDFCVYLGDKIVKRRIEEGFNYEESINKLESINPPNF